MKLVGQMVGEYLIEKNLKEKRRRAARPDKVHFSPSSIGFCSRKIVYQMSGYPVPELNPRVLAIFENGHSFHNRMEHFFDMAGILIAPELSINDEELNISGRTDAVIRNINSKDYQATADITLVDTSGEVVYSGPNNEVALVELKSINNKGYNRVVSHGPKEEHIAQLQLYMHLLNIPQGLLYYENKDNQESIEYWFTYDPALIKKLIAKIKNVNDHVDKGTIPAREGTRSSYSCNYCDFKDICWDDSLVIPSLDDII